MTAPQAPIPVPDVSAEARAWLYFAAWLLGSFGQLGSIIWLSIAAGSPDVDMPLWLVIGSPALAFITSQVHALARGNVTSRADNTFEVRIAGLEDRLDVLLELNRPVHKKPAAPHPPRL